MSAAKDIRHYVGAMIETLMTDVKTVYLGESGVIDSTQCPAALVEFVQEENEQVGTGNQEEMERLVLYLDVTFTVAQGTESTQQSPEDDLDDLKDQLRLLLKDDNFLMKGLVDYDPNGLNTQGLSTGVFYLSTTPVDANEGSERTYSYKSSYKVNYEDNSILDYRYDTMEGWTARFTDHIEQDTVLREAQA